MDEEKKKPKIISEKDAVQEAGVEEAAPEETPAESENAESAPEEQPAETVETPVEEKKPRVKVIVEPVFGERGAKPTAPIAGEKPYLVRELEEQAARDVLPMQSPPGTPLEAQKPLTRDEAAQRAREIWEEREEEKQKGKLWNRLKHAIGFK